MFTAFLLGSDTFHGKLI